MSEKQLCECTITCLGRHACELGTWVMPSVEAVKDRTKDALQYLGECFWEEAHTQREIVAALFESIPLIDDPGGIDLFASFYEAMSELGFSSSHNPSHNPIWFKDEIALSNKRLFMALLDEDPYGEPILLKNVTCTSKPKNFDRVLEFMAVLNFHWIGGKYSSTSEIAKLFFPGIGGKVLESWMTEAIDNTLYRIGYSPCSNNGRDKAGVYDDPVWFCDGDERYVLCHNLWRGEEIWPAPNIPDHLKC